MRPEGASKSLLLSIDGDLHLPVFIAIGEMQELAYLLRLSWGCDKQGWC